MQRPNTASGGDGFTLVQLAFAIAIIGILAAFGVPRFLWSVEHSRAMEAFDYLAAIRTSQERYQAQYGTYATHLGDLDLLNSPPRYFHVPTTFSTADHATRPSSWTLTLTRTGPSVSHGAYTVVFNETGFDAKRSTIRQTPARPNLNPIGE